MNEDVLFDAEEDNEGNGISIEEMIFLLQKTY